MLFSLATGSSGKDLADPDPRLQLVHVDELAARTASALESSGAPVDSLALLGGAGTLTGKFEDAAGLPDRQGWTGVDLTQRTESHWNVSDFQAATLDPGTPDNHAWWCGTVLEPCNASDSAEGYGPNWIEFLDWHGTVLEPDHPLTLRVQAMLRCDIEPGEEYLRLQVFNDGTDRMEELAVYSTIDALIEVDITTVLDQDYFTGDNGDEIHLRWSFNSDGAWDDADCLWPTDGAAQVDLIRVHFDQGAGPVQIGWTETCEAGDPLQWQPTLPRGHGEYSKVWPLLDDADPDADNLTPQFAFIDDGEVEPETGGSPCITHCYGPGGYIVNPVTGVSELYDFIDNRIQSPVLPVPAEGWNGAIFSFDQYVHAELNPGEPYVLGRWQVRSTADPAGLEGWSDWRWNGSLLWGPARYVREIHNVSDLLVPGFTHVQLGLGVINIYPAYYEDGTPAPYFDNVAFTVYRKTGPSSLLVRPDGTGDYPTIQLAINAAAVGDTVLLADGVYAGDGNRDLLYLGKEIVVRSRSGDPARCILDLQGAPGKNHRGVRFGGEEGPAAVLSGVTITGGYEEGSTSSYEYSGAAVYCADGSAPTISNCVFRGNSAPSSEQQGGAVFCTNASPLISDCVFEDNLAVHGGAVGARGVSAPRIDNCLFIGNEALTYGGAIVAYESGAHFTISSCTFTGNVNRAVTGTLVSYRNGRLDVDRSIIAFNSSGYAATSTDPADFHFTCTDIFGNTVGDWYGYFANQLGSLGNIAYDPLFCAAANPAEPYGLDERSPCRSSYNPTCGLVGYAPVACGPSSSVEEPVASARAAELYSCYPNPFNPSTTIAFRLRDPGRVDLAIYDVAGRRVRTLADSGFPAGRHELRWDGRDDGGRATASGVFFCRLRTTETTDTTRLVLLR